MMTLPSFASEALRRRHRDSGLRVVYPLVGWRVEATPDGSCRILTLTTDGGLAVSFAMPPGWLEEMAEAGARMHALPISH